MIYGFFSFINLEFVVVMPLKAFCIDNLFILLPLEAFCNIHHSDDIFIKLLCYYSSSIRFSKACVP